MARWFGARQSHAESSHARLRRLKKRHQQLRREKQSANAVLQFLIQEHALHQRQLQQMQQMHSAAQAALETALETAFAHAAAPPGGNLVANEAHAALQTAWDIANTDVVTTCPQHNPTLGKDVLPAHGQLQQQAQPALEIADEDMVPAKRNMAKAQELVAPAAAEANSVVLASAEIQDADGTAASCK